VHTDLNLLSGQHKINDLLSIIAIASSFTLSWSICSDCTQSAHFEMQWLLYWCDHHTS